MNVKDKILTGLQVHGIRPFFRHEALYGKRLDVGNGTKFYV